MTILPETILNNVDTQSLAVSAAFAYMAGSVAKKLDFFPNKYIPILVPFVGAVIMSVQEGWTLLNFAAGAFPGFSATGAHQAISQLTKKDDNENPQ